MNQKITVKTQLGIICYCIIDGKKDVEKQLAQVHGHTAGHGIAARMTETQIQFVDCFHDEVMCAHDILSIENTTEAISLQWNATADKE